MSYRRHIPQGLPRFFILLLLGNLWLSGCATGPRSLRSAAPRRSKPAELKTADHTAKANAGPAEDIEVKALAHYATGLAHDLSGEGASALEEYWQAALADPSHEPLVVEVARRFLRGQKPEKAVEILTKATAAPSASGSLYAWLGLAHGQAGQTNLAIAANRKAIQQMPRSLPAYQNLAQIYAQSGKTNEAIQVLDAAARQPALEAGFLVDLADFYARFARVRNLKGEPIKDRIKTVLDRATKLKPTHPFVLQKLGDAYLQAGEPDRAEGIYLQLVEKNPRLLLIRGKLADLYLRNGRKDKAAEQLQALAKEDPTNPRTQAFLGALASGENRFEAANQHFERALLLNPEIEQVYYDLAAVKLSMKKPQEALALLGKARAKFKLGFVMEFYTAVTYANVKQFADAIKHFTSAELLAKTEEPSRLTHFFYYQLGSVHERNGDHAQAEKYLQKCLELSPDYADALNYLGYMWADQGVKLEQARALIEKALEIEPGNAAFLDSLGWVLFKLHQPKEALAYILSAIEKSEEPDPTLYDHLGDIYATLDEPRQAKQAWQKSLSVESNEQVKRQLKRKLETPPSGEPAGP